MSAPSLELVLALILSAALMVGTPFLGFWLWFALSFQPAKASLAPLARELGLTPSVSTESVYEEWRPRYPWMRVAMARGVRGVFAVELFVQHALKGRTPTTTALVVSPRSVGAKVTVSRAPEYQPYRLMSAAVSGRTSIPFLGDVAVSHDASQIPRVFTPAVQQELAAFPRELMTVGFDQHALHLTWRGVEREAAVVEHAFRTAARCLHLLHG